MCWTTQRGEASRGGGGRIYHIRCTDLIEKSFCVSSLEENFDNYYVRGNYMSEENKMSVGEKKRLWEGVVCLCWGASKRFFTVRKKNQSEKQAAKVLQSEMLNFSFLILLFDRARSLWRTLVLFICHILPFL